MAGQNARSITTFATSHPITALETGRWTASIAKRGSSMPRRPSALTARCQHDCCKLRQNGYRQALTDTLAACVVPKRAWKFARYRLLVKATPRRRRFSPMQDLAQLPAVALGRSSLDRLRWLGNSLFLLPRSASDALGSLLIELARNACWAPLCRQGAYHDLQPLGADLNVDQFTDASLACRLYSFAFDAHST